MTDNYGALRSAAKRATPGPWMLDGMGEDEPATNYWAHRFIGTAKPNESGYHEVIASSEDGHGRNAEFIAAADPSTVLDLLDSLEAADMRVAQLEAQKPPCDGGCSYEVGPEETCSLHGRPVAEVWEIANRFAEERDNIARLHEVATERVVGYAAVIEQAAVRLSSHRTAEFVELEGTEWRWQCECGESFGHLDEGQPVPSGMSAVAWRLTEHHARILASADTDAALREVQAQAKREAIEWAADLVEHAHERVGYRPGPGETSTTNPGITRGSDIAAAIRDGAKWFRAFDGEGRSSWEVVQLAGKATMIHEPGKAKTDE